LLAQRSALVGSGALTEAELEEALRYLDDPERRVLTPVLYSAWGRRAVATT
jgi:hypothetical protein